MATQEAVKRISCNAGADLSAAANIYKFVEGNQNSVTLANADTDIIMGVLESLGIQGQAVSIAVEGVAKVRVSAVMAAETLVTADTDGRARAAVSGDRYRGVLMEASTAINDIVAVRLVDGHNLIA
jgi:hypothetical protein